ncbi:MAG: hypothetical protein EPN21_03575 [Methylococcaceae bacterium]|nr:MAG: hypothetical protein EPN21_03575 [Methylococcaceae bacterium]
MAWSKTHHAWLIPILLALALQGCSHTLPPGANSGALFGAGELLPPNDVWERMRRGFQLPDLADAAVQTQAERLAAHGLPERVGARAAPLLYWMVAEAEQRRLPLELLLLPFVESAFQPHAKSPVGAHGPWQFMAETARDSRLVMNRVHDDRRSWQAATRAALDLLQRLNAHFGDWQLAMAAYNAGPGRVDQALRRHGRHVRFQDLTTLPQETRQYLVQLYAWRAIIQTSQRYGVMLPTAPNLPVLDEVPVVQDIDVAVAARLAGLPEARFRQFNPAFAGPMIPAAIQPRLLLPTEAADHLQQGLAEARAESRSLAHWSLKRLEQPATAMELAQSWQVTPGQLTNWNPVAMGYRYQAGAMLFVPRRFPAQPDAGEIRYAALLTEPVPRPLPVKRKSRTARAQPLQARAIRVNYRGQTARPSRIKRGGTGKI